MKAPAWKDGPSGYCNPCNRIVNIDPETGLLILHTTGIGPCKRECEGSGRKPPKYRPTLMKSKAFKTTEGEAE